MPPRKEREMKGLLLNLNDNKTEVVEVNSLQDYYNLIGCNLIEIVSRKIGRKRFDIVCDEEGTFVAEPKISAIDNLGAPMFVGNLIICGQADEEGELTDLSGRDINYIKQRIVKMCTHKHPEGYLMLTQCEY